MINIKLLIEYDGTNYHGWQIQENAVTVQESIENALTSLLNQDIRLTASGRTDTGVHARGQVVNFKIKKCNIPIKNLPKALNTTIEPDIVVKDAQLMPLDFNSRISAKSKIYSYSILNTDFPSPIDRLYSYHVSKPINIEKIKEAGKLFIGTHDFTSFKGSKSKVNSSFRTIYDFKCKKDNNKIILYFHGEGFLYNMVRIMSGTLLNVGIGKLKPSEISRIINAKSRAAAGDTLPANGLVLEKVIY